MVCTGRSSGQARYEYDRPETIEETAELVTGLGGTGIVEVVDHLDPAQVAALATRIRDRHGHLDVLVNDIWGGELLKQWYTPVWEHDLDAGLRMLRLAIDTHLITSHHLLPLLVGPAGRAARGGHRRNGRLQRHPLPALRVLRPGQGGGEPPGVLAGPRAGAARRAPRWRSRRDGCARR